VDAADRPDCALLPTRWLRPALAVQVVTALLVQHLLFTGW
jgi:hypothetical protein